MVYKMLLPATRKCTIVFIQGVFRLPSRLPPLNYCIRKILATFDPVICFMKYRIVLIKFQLNIKFMFRLQLKVKRKYA